MLTDESEWGLYPGIFECEEFKNVNELDQKSSTEELL